MDINNKRLDQTRENDKLIYELIENPFFKIKQNGEIWRNLDYFGNNKRKWCRVDKQLENGYRSINFKYKSLNAARIIFAKYGDCSLIAEKVINHKDGNKGNNEISNLELVTYSENNLHRYRILEAKEAKETLESVGKSGQIWATCDDIVRNLLNDPNYKVKRDGTVWTKIAVTGKVSVKNIWRETGCIGGQGYISIGYKNKKLLRSRIVYCKFNGNLQMDLVVNHIDGNKVNDRPSNLELVTQSENNRHAYKKGRKPVAGNRKITPKIAVEIVNLAKDGWTNKMLRQKFKLAKSTISYIVNGRVWNRELAI